jgi:hypothetical protein
MSVAAERPDPRIVERVKKLLTLSKGSWGGEADNARLTAEKLMRQHGIAEADLVEPEPAEPAIEPRELFWCAEVLDPAAELLGSVCGTIYPVDVYREEATKQVRLYFSSDDRDTNIAAHATYLHLQHQIDDLVARHSVNKFALCVALLARAAPPPPKPRQTEPSPFPFPAVPSETRTVLQGPSGMSFRVTVRSGGPSPARQGQPTGTYGNARSGFTPEPKERPSFIDLGAPGRSEAERVSDMAWDRDATPARLRPCWSLADKVSLRLPSLLGPKVELSQLPALRPYADTLAQAGIRSPSALMTQSVVQLGLIFERAGRSVADYTKFLAAISTTHLRLRPNDARDVC